MRIYVALLTGGKESDYGRVYTDEFDHVPELDEFREFLLHPAVDGGYGLVNAVALYGCETGGEPLKVFCLPEPVDVHAGVIPFLHGGKLMRGVEVRAESLTRTDVAVSLGENC